MMQQQQFIYVSQKYVGRLEVGKVYGRIDSDESGEWWTTEVLDVALEQANLLAAHTGVPAYVIESRNELYQVVSKAVM